MASNAPSLSSPSPALDAAPGDFRIQAPAEILALLQMLLAQRTRVVLSSASGLSWTVRLCAVDAALGLELLDDPADDASLHALLGADEINAAAYLDQIRVEFEIDGLMRINGASGTSLRTALPALLYRFQRRQSFRVRPNSRTPQVRWTDPAHATPLRARILDLSLGGLALLLPPGLAPWPEGQVLQAVHIELDRDTRFEAALRVQHVHPTTPDGTLMGLAFIPLGAEADRMLQRYIEQTQKFGRLLRKG